MKAAIIFACLLAVAFARPNPDVARPNSDVKIVDSKSDVGPESYSFHSETSDGTKRDESGQLKEIGTDHETIVVNGSFTWTDEKTGETFKVDYIADENGFQPSGAHLPVAPVAPVA